MDAQMTLSFEKAEGYLMVAETGKITSDSIKSSIREIADTAKQQGLNRVLVDARKLTSPMNTMNRFFTGEEIAREWRGLRVAILVPEGSINKFMENTAVNRGAKLIVVSNLDEAVRWLTDNPVKP